MDAIKQSLRYTYSDIPTPTTQYRIQIFGAIFIALQVKVQVPTHHHCVSLFIGRNDRYSLPLSIVTLIFIEIWQVCNKFMRCLGSDIFFILVCFGMFRALGNISIFMRSENSTETYGRSEIPHTKTKKS